MAYERRIDSLHPCCLVLLLDQSYSMLEPIAGGTNGSKAEAAAAAVNSVLRRLAGDGVGDPAPCHVAVIGYGHEVRTALSGSLRDRELVDASELAAHAPTCVEPVASGATPMSAALERARVTVAAWVESHPSSFPPVVVNVSDGAATDGDPASVGQALRALRTDDGPTLIFNATVSSLGDDTIAFAADVGDLPDDAHDLFDLSSVIPLRMHPVAHRLGQSLDPGSRGLVVNAGPATLALLLEIAMSPLFVDPKPVHS
jgi:uncharacterized protein YegL